MAIATSTATIRATVPATATARIQPTDDGCAVVAPNQTGTPWWLLVIPGLLIMRCWYRLRRLCRHFHGGPRRGPIH
jgi:hypothetical protein